MNALALALGLVLLLRAGEDPATRRGESELLNGNFAQALRDFDVAAKRAADAHERARVELLRAQCFAAMNDFGGVDAAFTAALRADPEVQLDRSQVLPALVDRLDALRLRLQGTLVLRVEPREARVELDGQALGRTPVKTTLPIGRHHVKLVHSDGRVVEREVVLRPDSVERVEVDFAQVPRPPPPVQPGVKASSPPVEAAHDEPGLRLSASARANYQPRVGVGAEGTVGLSGRYWRVDLGVNVASRIGLTVRAGAQWLEALGPVGFYATADGALIFAGADVPGVGASLGVQVRALPWLHFYAEGEYLALLGTTRFTGNNFLIGAGARFYLWGSR